MPPENQSLELATIHGTPDLHEMHRQLLEMSHKYGAGETQVAKIHALVATIHDLHKCDTTGDAVQQIAQLKSDYQATNIINGHLNSHTIAEQTLDETQSHAIENILQAA